MAAELAAAQKSLGTDARVCLLEGGATAERIRQLGVRVHEFDPQKEFSSKSARWDELYRGFEAICRDVKPDVLHSHLALPNVLCDRWKRKHKTKWVATLHGSWRQYMYSPETQNAAWRRPYLLLRYSLGVAWTTRRADGIVTMTYDAAKDWKIAHIDPKRITVIPNGIAPIEQSDRSLRSAWGVADDTFVIGTLGYFAPVKGFDLLIPAFERIAGRFPDAHLMIAGGDVLGNSELRDELEKLRQNSRAKNQITLLGTQSPSAAYLAALDGFVLASRSEGMSLALLEAMHLGLPCVVSSAGGNPEAVRDGVDGFVFRSESVDELAERLAKLLEDRTRAKAMGDSAKERAQTEYSILKCAKEYAAYYETLMIA
jgi:glycosyltransferase involved in cell wall biosynthesis